MKKLYIILLTLFFVGLGTELLANGGTSERTITEFLDKEGNFHNPDGYTGNIDIAGFTMAMDDNGAPVFAMEGEFEDNWHALGDGTNDRVRALAVSGDNLYVGGDFTGAGGVTANHIARYDMDDGSWHALGDGTNGIVRALAITGDDLFFGGNFTSAGGVAASRIARYDITNGSWHALGEGVDWIVLALSVTGDDLFVGGDFIRAGGVAASRIARYDITNGSWHALGDGFNSSVWALAITEDDLFVGGDFTSTGSGDEQVNRIARYDITAGSWHTLGDGVNGFVRALALRKDDLFVGGTFTSAGGEEVNRIARYDITAGSWHTLGDGVNSSVRALAVREDDLFVGGAFTSAGGEEANRIARYNIPAGSWHAFGDGVNSSISALAVSGDDLLVGGEFTNAGGVEANKIARWSPAPPKIQNESPIAGSDRVAVDATVSVEFDQDVLEVDLNGVVIEDNESNAVGGVIASLSGNVLAISHDDFAFGTEYTVTISPSTVQDTMGTGNLNFNWNFTTILAAPKAEQKKPEAGNMNVAVDSDVNTEFDQDISEVDLSGVVIEDSEGNAVGGVTASLTDNVLAISHDDFTIGTEYTVTIPAGSVQNADEVPNNVLTWSFSVPLPPGELSLIAPENGAAEIPINPVLEWSQSEEIATYKLNISTDPEFVEDLISIEDITDNSYNISSTLLNQTTYYWRARAVNSVGISNWTEAWSFTTVEITPPPLLNPDSGSFAEPPFELAWESIANPENFNFDLHISGNEEFSDTLKFVSGINDSLYTIPTSAEYIANGDTLHWKMRKLSTVDPSIISVWSESRSVIIRVNEPEIVSPRTDELLERPVTLEWAGERGNDDYVFDINVTVGRDTVDSRNGLTGMSYVSTLPRTNQRYEWFIRKRSVSNSELKSEWNRSEFFVKADFIRLRADTAFTSRPSNVNVFLSAIDEDGRGITTLELDDFQLLENERTIVEAETNLQVAQKDDVSSALKTVLLLNNSLSIGEENIEFIKEAAKEFVRNKAPEQEIAVKVFAERSELVVPFTTDKNTLLTALDDFSITNIPGTDVHGSVVEALDLWEDEFSFTNITQGFLLLFTDGRDLAGTTSLEEVLEARGEKRVFAIGVENRPEDFDEETLRAIGNAGTIIEEDFDNLVFSFIDIQERLESLSNSFYWFNYSSARRSDDGELNIQIANNRNTGPDRGINIFFDASEFFGVPIDILVNATPENPGGVDEITMAGDDTLGVRIETAFSFQTLPFEFEISDPTKLQIEPVGDDSFIFNFIGNGLEGDVIEVAIADTASPTLGLEKTLIVRYGERQFGPPTVTPLLPENEAVRVSLTPQFEWAEVEDTDGYRFQLSADDKFTSLLSDTLITATTFAPDEPLERESTYYWRVRVENADENSQWSQDRSFTTLDRPVPEDLRVQVSDGVIALHWDIEDLDESAAIRIYGGKSTSSMDLIAELGYDARTYSSDLESGILYAVSILYSDGTESDFSNTVSFSEESFQFSPSWDLVSISIRSDQTELNNSDVYEFSGVYSATESLKPGKGYWVRSDENEELVLAGDGVSQVVYQVRRGWNLIGSLISEVDVSSIEDPGNVLTSTPIFSYMNGVYTESTTLFPGRGYWLYAAEEGEVSLELSAGEEASIATAVTAKGTTDEKLQRIRFSNSHASQTFFTSNIPLDDNELQSYRMPPKAPAPLLDVRSGEYRVIDRKSESLQLESNKYPVNVRLEQTDDAFESDYIYRILAMDEGTMVHYNLSSGSDVAISKEYDELILERIHRDEAITDFAISQNYPNPFNPTTTIRYQLANQADVAVIVYDILGRRVATLVNATQQSGVYTVTFDANHLASGIYLLRIQAGSFTDIQTMTLIK